MKMFAFFYLTVNIERKAENGQQQSVSNSNSAGSYLKASEEESTVNYFLFCMKVSYVQ